MDTPYHVMGGLQDNGSWFGPGVTWHNGGIRYYDWEEVGFGDGFDTFRDPNHPRYGFATSQNAGVVRFDLETGERKYVVPMDPDTTNLRFNWQESAATGLYIVYNDTEAFDGLGPVNRAFIVKYSHMFDVLH